MIKHFLKNLILDTDLNEAVKHSYKKYHSPGVDYINLLRTPNLTAKLYFFEPTKIDYLDDGCSGEGIVVNPHSHLYDFETYVIKGRMRNVCYYENIVGSTDWHSYNYRTPLSSKNHNMKKIEYKGISKLAGNPSKIFKRGESYSFKDDGIHSIWVDNHEKTILFLLQHHRKNKDCTKLFMKKQENLNIANLYEFFTKQEIRDELEILINCYL